MTAASAEDEEEQTWLRRADEEAVQLDARLKYFALAQGTNSRDVLGFINELNGFLATFEAWQPEADMLKDQGRPAFGQQLAALMQRVQYSLQTQQLAYNTKLAWERYQEQQQRQSGMPPIGGIPD